MKTGSVIEFIIINIIANNFHDNVVRKNYTLIKQTKERD